MAIKFFWMYVGSALALSVLLATVVKKFSDGFASSGKKPYVYGTFSSVIASLGAYGSTLISDQLYLVFWILAGIFLLFGIVHMVFVHKKYFSGHKRNWKSVLIGELLFALSMILFCIVVFSSLQYFLKDRDFLFYPMAMSMLAFFLPILFMQTFTRATSIPSAEFATWEYPLDKVIDLPEEDPREKLYVIGFEIPKKHGDSKRTYFRAKAPENMKLGELYYHFINDYNELHSETPIVFENDYHADEWWFRRKPKWYQGHKILDPALTVRENKIKENTIIICERIIGESQPVLV